ncbi:MAG: hypothetical protein IH585_07680 [Anaerolineaceae bacterium]|nr:hypothetical protein [Anaerolineaceae bacterium]
MLFNCIELTGRRIGTTSLVGDRVAGGVLVRIGKSPPQVSTILADPSFDEVTAVIILRHADLIPGDGNLIAIPDCANILRGTIHVRADRLQIGDDVAYGVEITHHIDDRV